MLNTHHASKPIITKHSFKAVHTHVWFIRKHAFKKLATHTCISITFKRYPIGKSHTIPIYQVINLIFITYPGLNHIISCQDFHFKSFYPLLTFHLRLLLTLINSNPHRIPIHPLFLQSRRTQSVNPLLTPIHIGLSERVTKLTAPLCMHQMCKGGTICTLTGILPY